MNCFIFDIDGVITDIEEKKVKEPKIIEIISSLLEKGTPVIFITGRSLDWVEKTVLSYLENNIQNKKSFGNLFVIGEFGGVAIEFENGNKHLLIDKTLTFPNGLIKDAIEATNRYSDIMFVDKTKKTVFISEVKSGVDLENNFNPKQKDLIKKYQEIVDKYNLDKLEVHKDRLGTNIRYKKSNKGNSIKLALKWLEEKGFEFDKLIVFGDSESDLEMAEELRRQNKNFDFIYVGNKEEIEDQNLSGIKFTKEKFEKGTLEYLTSIALR